MPSTELPRPVRRPLTVYAFDPSHGRSLGNYMTIAVPYEPLEPGPQSAYVRVIDYDSSNRKYYKPVNLEAPQILLQDGLSPSESNPQFHQQMVYAVARETMHQFERALGRRIKWGFRRRDPLRIFPHAFQDANAYYDRRLRALVFGYFSANSGDPGRNLPGQTIYTCLSHDIVAHETTHAILDGQRRYFMQDTNPDVAAFHEGFADIVALFQHFTYGEALYDTMVKTGGRIFRSEIGPRLPVEGDQVQIAAQLRRNNPLIALAQQFGEAMGLRAALRNALMFPPRPGALEEKFEAHDRGAILVAAVFDAFFTSFEKKTADLFRIARSGGGVISDDLHPDLAKRLCGEASKLAQHFVTMCIRAIDYCPPVDITFGDYLRALVTSDAELYPDDPYEYREALIEAFRLRGIRPDNVVSMSEESLRWTGVSPGTKSAPACTGLRFDLLRGESEAVRKRNFQRLHAFATQYRPELKLVADEDSVLSVDSYHPLVRVDEGTSRVEIVVELIQRKDVLLDPADPESPKLRLYGGSTVHLNADGSVRYVIHRRLGTNDADPRLARVRGYWEGKRDLTYVDREDIEPTLDTTLNFALLHRGV